MSVDSQNFSVVDVTLAGPRAKLVPLTWPGWRRSQKRRPTRRFSAGMLRGWTGQPRSAPGWRRRWRNVRPTRRCPSSPSTPPPAASSARRVSSISMPPTSRRRSVSPGLSPARSAPASTARPNISCCGTRSRHGICAASNSRRMPRNQQSRAALLRLGAVEEGTLRKHMVMPDGSARDSVYFSIIDVEWPEVRARLEAQLRPT